MKQAAYSAASVKKYTELSMCLFTDMSIGRETFDSVVTCKAHHAKRDQYMIDRLTNLPNTPYDRTLALDTDTVLMADVSDLFDLLDRFDVVMAHGHNRELRHDRAEADGMADLPRSFAPVQGGLLLYRRNERVWSFLADLISLYQEKQYDDDQVSMRQLLYQREDLRIYILPLEYNFNSEKDIERWDAFNFVEARPKIFHYTRHKRDWQQVVGRYDAKL